MTLSVVFDVISPNAFIGVGTYLYRSHNAIIRPIVRPISGILSMNGSFLFLSGCLRCGAATVQRIILKAIMKKNI